MSFHHIPLIWATVKQEPAFKCVRPVHVNERIVLLAIADHAADPNSTDPDNPPHSCYPSNKRLADYTGLSTRAVQRAVQTLIARGWIVAKEMELKDRYKTSHSTAQTSNLITLSMPGIEHLTPTTNSHPPTTNRRAPHDCQSSPPRLLVTLNNNNNQSPKTTPPTPPQAGGWKKRLRRGRTGKADNFGKCYEQNEGYYTPPEPEPLTTA